MKNKKLKLNKPGLFEKAIGLEETCSVMPKFLEHVRKTRKEGKDVLGGESAEAPEGGKPGATPKKPKTVDTTKGFGYFEKKFNETIGLPTYRKGLILAIKILQHCPVGRDEKNPPLLDVMGIDRNQIIEILKRIFGSFNDRFEQNIVITSIGNFNNHGKINPFLFKDVFSLNEHSGNKEIDDLLNGLEQIASKFNEAEQDKFFRLPDMDKYLSIFQAIEKGEVKEEHVIGYARSKLCLGRENIPMMDFLGGVDLDGEPIGDTPKFASDDRGDKTKSDNVDSIRGAVKITSKIYELIELAEQVRKLEKMDPMREKLSEFNHAFFDYFLALGQEVPLGQLPIHLIRILMIAGKPPTKESVNQDLENLYDEVGALHKQAE